ncbi:hypothetical protein [Vibrio neptunius]|uniref:hypothetical protein n=1 Tax=Vibrio neptunius TaxID=170651 RepID=UPI001C5CA0F6|nr:hypothetical protein [Vibrio neptunius]QXX06088.1 hypothetical protein KW548_13295 [Vibrio neptunius]
MSNSLPDKELFVECPQCKKDIKQKNLKRHLRKIHGEKIAPIQPTSFPETPSTSRTTSRTERINALFSKINQGQYDNQDSLVRLMKNAEAKGEQTILKAVQQRLRKVFPKLYRRYVGPITLRDPLGSKNCYCAKPTSLHNIAHDILNMTIPTEALQCDLCWDEDITVAWGVYGPFGAKVIDKHTWTTTCHERGDVKYATH